MKLNTNPFSYELDESDIRMIRHNCNTKGIPNTIASYLRELDLPNYPYIQTIHFRYKWIMKALLYLGYDKESLEKIHEANLKYEETHPPIVYEKKKGTTKTVSKRITKSSPIKERKVDSSPVNPKLELLLLKLINL